MRKLALIIMDGFGVGSERSNAIVAAGTPNLDRFMAKYPHTLLQASGLAVGLPQGQIGNSEVGHLNIGAGHVVYQDIARIDEAILSGEFYQNPALLAAIENAKGKALHIGGLLSDGGVHSTIEHLFAILKMAKQAGLKRVYVHCFMDGRDVSPSSGADYIRKLESFCASVGVGEVASVMGRYYIMDRDNRWERVERGFNCMSAGIGNHCQDAAQYVEECYKKGEMDEFVQPCAVIRNGKYNAEFENGDSFICFNFRADRAREFSRAILEQDFHLFERAKGYLKLFYVGMTQYDASFKGMKIAFEPKNIQNTLGEIIARKNLRQLRLAETEKYAHVTFFFNGGREQPNEGESRILIPSPKVATYDLQPEMSANEVCEAALKALNENAFDVLIINFANCDMVGHTGDFDATVKAVQVVDNCVGRLTDAMLKAGGVCLITADHGNAEQMSLENGSPWTAHTTNPVPLIVADDITAPKSLQSIKKLADIAGLIVSYLP